MCFHSYFNDKTIFGKETIFSIPFSNISHIQKKSNVFVPNSISVQTKEGKEIFITSFMYRDQAFDLIQNQLSSVNGRSADSRTNSGDQMNLGVND